MNDYFYYECTKSNAYIILLKSTVEVLYTTVCYEKEKKNGYFHFLRINITIE